MRSWRRYLPTKCNGICKRFLAQLRRVHNNNPDYSHGPSSMAHKPQIENARRTGYDKTTYDYRVVKGYSATFNSNYEGYRRCAKCEIYIAVGFFDNTCPCCGNSKLSVNILGRGSRSYGKVRY